MIYALLAAGAAALAAIVTLATIAIRATSAKADALGIAAKATADAVKSDHERIDAVRAKAVVEVELAAAHDEAAAVREQHRAAEIVAKELYAELRRRGVEGAAERLDDLFAGVRREAEAQRASRAAGASGDPGTRVSDRDTRPTGPPDPKPLP